MKEVKCIRVKATGNRYGLVKGSVYVSIVMRGMGEIEVISLILEKEMR